MLEFIWSQSLIRLQNRYNLVPSSASWAPKQFEVLKMIRYESTWTVIELSRRINIVSTVSRNQHCFGPCQILFQCWLFPNTYLPIVFSAKSRENTTRTHQRFKMCWTNVDLSPPALETHTPAICRVMIWPMFYMFNNFSKSNRFKSGEIAIKSKSKFFKISYRSKSTLEFKSTWRQTF